MVRPATDLHSKEVVAFGLVVDTGRGTGGVTGGHQNGAGPKVNCEPADKHAG